jgi:hypothetical protein
VGAAPVFISHAAADSGHAAWWCRTLEAEGLTCWVAPRDMPLGADWAEQIVLAINAAQAMLLLVSVSAMASPQVRREIERAVHKRLPVLSLRLDDAELTRSFEYFLGAQHWVAADPAGSERQIPVVLRALHGLASPHSPVASPRVPMPIPVAHPGARLAQITERLARDVGPVAAVLVERAARRARSDDELLSLLAGEIDDPQVRQRFVTAARSG